MIGQSNDIAHGTSLLRLRVFLAGTTVAWLTGRVQSRSRERCVGSGSCANQRDGGGDGQTKLRTNLSLFPRSANASSRSRPSNQRSGWRSGYPAASATPIASSTANAGSPLTRWSWSTPRCSIEFMNAQSPSNRDASTGRGHGGRRAAGQPIWKFHRASGRRGAFSGGSRNETFPIIGSGGSPIGFRVQTAGTGSFPGEGLRQDDNNRDCLPRDCGVNLVVPHLHRRRHERLGVSGPKYKAAHQSSRGVEGVPLNLPVLAAAWRFEDTQGEIDSWGSGSVDSQPLEPELADRPARSQSGGALCERLIRCGEREPAVMRASRAAGPLSAS